LTGAKKLAFWARSAKGGEAVDFNFGLTQKGKYKDTASGEPKGEKLTKEWKQ